MCIRDRVSEEVVDALVHSSSLPLLVAAIVFSIWGVSAYLRCLDYVLRRRLVAIATICALWMIEVILKYKSFTPFYATVLWYLYYVCLLYTSVALPAGTNGPRPEAAADMPTAGDSYCYWKADKWVLCHADSPKAAEGGYVGLVGKNLDITVD